MQGKIPTDAAADIEGETVAAAVGERIGETAADVGGKGLTAAADWGGSLAVAAAVAERSLAAFVLGSGLAVAVVWQLQLWKKFGSC